MTCQTENILSFDILSLDIVYRRKNIITHSPLSDPFTTNFRLNTTVIEMEELVSKKFGK